MAAVCGTAACGLPAAPGGRWTRRPQPATVAVMTTAMAPLLAQVIPVIAIPLALELRQHLNAIRREASEWWAARPVRMTARVAGLPGERVAFRRYRTGRRLYGSHDVWPLPGVIGTLLAGLGRQELVVLRVADGGLHMGPAAVTFTLIVLAGSLLVVAVVPVLTQAAYAVSGRATRVRPARVIMLIAVAAVVIMFVFSAAQALMRSRPASQARDRGRPASR